MTGSGRIYNLLDFDRQACLKAGFSAPLVTKFLKGFPDNWKQLLVAELAISQRPASPPRSAGPKSVLKTPAKSPGQRTSQAARKKTPATVAVRRTRALPSPDTPKVRRGRVSE